MIATRGAGRIDNMIAALLLLSSAPTLSEVQRAAPADAGALVLGNTRHEPIVAVEPVPREAPVLFDDVDLIERPVVVAGGCVRQRWRATFPWAWGKPPGAGRLTRVVPINDVALRGGPTCPVDGYVSVSSGLTPAAALSALVLLREWQAGRATPRFSCVDYTTSGLCDSPAHLRPEIARLKPRMVSTADNKAVKILMGARGGLLTSLRFVPAARVVAVEVWRGIEAPS